MRVTRRFWGVAGSGLVLAALGVVLGRRLLLVGAAGLGGWLVARQALFVARATRALDRLTVEQSVGRERLRTDEAATVRVGARLPTPSPLDLAVEAAPPTAATPADGAGRTAVLSRGGTDAETAFRLTWPVAGRFRFDPPAVTLTDRHGLFRSAVARGPAPSVAVDPRTPRNVHVGEGGERVAASIGEHRTGRQGPGFDPAELREYVAGDSARRIDWKATARLNEPHVREYEAETDRTSVLVLDGRPPTAVGSEGERVFDYLRQVALAFVGTARRLNDPLGLAAVDDAGLTVWEPPAAAATNYATFGRRLRDLGPGTRGSRPAVRGDDGGSGRSPADARRAADALADDGTAFGATLRPFLAANRAYVARFDERPLFAAVRTRVAGLPGQVRTVLFTDDTDRAELHETVKLARRGDDRVLAFVAPRVLFEPGGLADLEVAYDRYVEFESFRRDLARLDRVSAFEVAPADRLGAVLGAGRGRRRAAAGGG